MAMIARVHPFKQSSDHHNSGYNGGRMQIEDVTDDPKYKDIDEFNENGLEGSLIEYCRLDKNPNTRPPRHSVCEASTVVKAKLNPTINIKNAGTSKVGGPHAKLFTMGFILNALALGKSFASSANYSLPIRFIFKRRQMQIPGDPRLDKSFWSRIL